MLKYRLFSGTLLIAALLVIVFVRHWLAGLLMAGLAFTVITLSLREFFAMTKELDCPGYPKTTWLASAALIVLALPVAQQLRGAVVAPDILVIGLLLMAGFLQVCRHEDRAQGLRNLMASLLGFFYLGWTLAFLVEIYFMGQGGPILVFFLILATKCGDIGGYTLGNITARAMAGGNHKMVPKLSPKKSWEGFVGSLLFSALAGWLLVMGLGDRMTVAGQVVLSPLVGAVLGAILAAVGLFGDLCASVLKRASGFKDSGSVLPGMGGVLDVIDSLIFVAPLFYWYLLLVSQAG